ncbi:MAG TPA: CPBP family intramembrane glutamic endopeptidase [Candidatus Limnocylindrales bacterium]|nr:CPBP family intramembrane glutamic endopeptidase [Candidatus Limnocylindrales bacterium]
METTIRVLVALALTGLLIMLRLDAARFGAAEYDEPVAGEGRIRAWSRRIAWYVLGLALVAAIVVIHPTATRDLLLAVGDRAGGVVLGVFFGLAGATQAVALAWYHYRRVRLPDPASYPGALTNEILTAFIDEATFRGALLGFLLLWGVDPLAAIPLQAIAYTLATRLGAPGRDRYMFGLSLVIGLVAGWASVATGGIAAAFLGHAITRVAVFLTTGHAGQPAPRGREIEDVEKRRRAPEGWRPVERPR